MSLDVLMGSEFRYVYENGPEIISTIKEAKLRGNNCESLAHLAIKSIYGVKLPPQLKCYELFQDTSYFRTVDSNEPMRVGDLLFFGSKRFEERKDEVFIPQYDGAQITNFDEFSVNHLGIMYDPSLPNPRILHASQQDGTNVLWTLEDFAKNKRFMNLERIKRLI